MFRRSRQKIVVVIMAVLIMLLLGTLCVIYSSSYIEVYRKNQDMLAHHIELYKSRNASGSVDPPADTSKSDVPPDFDDAAFQLSTFYTVLISSKGTVLDVDNVSAGYSDDELAKIALKIINKKSRGKVGNLLYRYETYGDGILVAFMDNALMQESITTLFRYTLIFGGTVIILMFFLARFAAKKIVTPLEESYQRQKQFISDAGHELKTPVSVVSANAEMLEREIGRNQWLANIQYENARMGALVTQLLELARTEQVIPEMTEVDLSRLVMGEALPFESVAYEHGIRLESSVADHIRVLGNAHQLSQLVSILIDNGIRHSKSGCSVTILLFSEKKDAILSVVNEGIPIPEEQKELLFERFYRADEARNGDDKHYGLGLAIAKSIVLAHRGTIKVCCRDGLVEFRVQLSLL